MGFALRPTFNVYLLSERVASNRATVEVKPAIRAFPPLSSTLQPHMQVPKPLSACYLEIEPANPDQA